MNTDRELMQQALEAMESVTRHFTRTPSTLRDSEVRGEAHKAITALRERLAQPVQEPRNLFEAFEQYGEGWERLAWELCADEHGEEACTELIWEGGPIPEPWGDRWLKYEDEAKRLISLVHKHTTPPQRKPLTDEEIDALALDDDGLPNSHLEFARAIEAKLREKNA